MAYSFQDRLAFNSSRFGELNVVDANYVRGATSAPIRVSPILHKPVEMGENGSLIRLEMECFGIFVSALQIIAMWPPADGDKVVLVDGSEFRVSKPTQNDPPFGFVTSRRQRILLYTKRVKGPT
jgi:hypothetical protein